MLNIQLLIHSIYSIIEKRAGDEAQTRDPQLGRLMLYQLSYSRKTISE